LDGKIRADEKRSEGEKGGQRGKFLREVKRKRGMGSMGRP